MQHPHKNEKHKRAFIVWLAIFPLITTIFYLFGDVLLLLPLLARTFLLTVVIVPLVFYLLVPFYTRLFNSWFK